MPAAEPFPRIGFQITIEVGTHLTIYRATNQSKRTTSFRLLRQKASETVPNQSQKASSGQLLTIRIQAQRPEERFYS